MNSTIRSFSQRVPLASTRPRSIGSRQVARHAAEITDASFEAEVIEASKKVPVLVDVWAVWCGPCKLVAAALPGLEKQYGDKLKIVKVNADDCPKVVEDYKVYGLPTLMVFKDGKMVDGSKKEGAIPGPAIVKHLEKYGVPLP